ncbi:MAG: hypothetical protein L3K26_01085 [Candidatus Hydrogenedentes bacterium]|nr:hypothetical protein [Candidatus Hydrogenedentota bacterium]
MPDAQSRLIQYAPPLLLAFGLLAVVLFHGVRATHDIAWPADFDAYRDIAQAQSMLDQSYPEDYLISDAWLWFNPLTGALVAAVSWLADIPAHLAHVRMAPYINLVVPITFFLLVWYLADLWVALAALVSFLFFLPQELPTYVSAGYSPWLLAPHLTQALFYVTLLACTAQGARPTWRRALGAGALLGITFLGHAAPAVLLGCITLITTGLAIWREKHNAAPLLRKARHFALLGLMLLTAFVVSLPFTISILFRYHLHIVNPVPTQWVWSGAALGNLPRLLKELVNWRTAIVLVGLYYVIRTRAPRPFKEAALLWPGVAMAFLVYSYLVQWAARYEWTLPQITPGYHYVLYVTAAGHFFFGIGLVALVDGVILRIRCWMQKNPDAENRWMTLRSAVLLLVVLVLFATHYRSFRVWHGFTRERTVVQKRMAKTDNFAPYHWIADNLDSNAVFLCDDQPGLLCVAVAGARVVAVAPHFMSPYVPYEPRAQARHALWEALRTGDAMTFQRIAAEYKVTHVLANTAQQAWLEESDFPFIQQVFESEQFAIYVTWELLSANATSHAKPRMPR